jgi:hypothetical protein
MSTNSTERAEFCAFCDAPIFGGPGCWHDETGREACPAGYLPNVFHEPRDIEAQEAARLLGQAGKGGPHHG